MARWLGGRGTAAADRFVHDAASAVFPVRLVGGGGIDSVHINLADAQWHSPAIRAEMARLERFLDTAPRDGYGQLHGTFSSRLLNLQLVDIERLDLTVAGRMTDPVNDAPIVAHPLADRSLNEDTAFAFRIPAGSFTDPDDAGLSYTARLSNGVVLPAWLKFDAATRSFTGKPPADFIGKLDIRVTAGDGEFSASDVLRLTVLPVNDAPERVKPLIDRVLNEDSAFSFGVPPGSFDDVDDASLSYTARLANGAVLPAWLEFDAAMHSFVGEPPLDFSGALDIRVTASDGQLSASDVFRLTIRPVNDAPDLAKPLIDRAINEDSPFNFRVSPGSFEDVDSAQLTYAVRLANGAALPAWLKFDAQTQSFSGMPPQDFNGALDLKVTASDGRASASDTFRFTVKPVNDAPVLANPLSHQDITEEEPWSFALPADTFTDVDSVVSINATGLAPWMDYDSATRTLSGTPPALGPVGGIPIHTIVVSATDGQFTVSDFLLVRVLPDF